MINFFSDEHGGADVAAGFFEVVLVGDLFCGECFFEAGSFAVEAVAYDAVDFIVYVIVWDLASAGFKGGVDEGLFDELFACVDVGLIELLFEFGALIAAVELWENGCHG